MFKKILLVAMATLLTTSLIACKSDSEDKAEDATTHINSLNDINQQLANKGVVVITSVRFTSRLSRSVSYTNAELAEIVSLLNSFVSHGNVLLGMNLADDPEIIWGDEYKLQNAIDNANNLLDQASRYETYEIKMAQAQQRAEQQRIADAARRAREALERLQQEKNNNAYDALVNNINVDVEDLRSEKILLKNTSALQKTADLINREQIKNMNLKKLEKASALLTAVVTNADEALTMIKNISVRATYSEQAKLIGIRDNAKTYLPIVRARIEGLTKVSPKAEATGGNNLGTVYTKDAVGE